MKKYALLTLIFFALSFKSIKQPPRYKGCFAKNNGTLTNSLKDKYQLFDQSGNANIDAVTQAELIRIQSIFLINATFFFYDDFDGKNAQASEEVLNMYRGDGTIIFGRRLFNREWIRSFGGTTIPIIMAHEYAHLVDFKFGVLNNVSSKKRELFADFLAGTYLYYRTTLPGFYTDINATLDCFNSLGDTDFGKADHHGTPQERKDALMGGFNYVRPYFQRNTPVSLDKLIEAGRDYINKVNDTKDQSVIIPD